MKTLPYTIAEAVKQDALERLEKENARLRAELAALEYLFAKRGR